MNPEKLINPLWNVQWKAIEPVSDLHIDEMNFVIERPVYLVESDQK